jgi:hypothetical protein
MYVERRVVLDLIGVVYNDSVIFDMLECWHTIHLASPKWLVMTYGASIADSDFHFTSIDWL